MKVIYGLGKVKSTLKNNVLTLGIFDGLHIGHQYLLKKAIKKAKSIGKSVIVLTFWPHPKGTLHILSLNQRLNFISKLGIDYCVVIQFTKKFSSISAENFIRILINKFRPVGIFVGKDFRFGKGALGDIKLLKDYAKKFDFVLYEIRQVKISGNVISSTRIRNLIQKGNLNLAERLLGHPITIDGKVGKGRCVGKLLGYPTANIEHKNQVLPPKGVYAVKIFLDKKTYYGLSYIGRCPTFKEVQKNTINLEVHIFNFNKDIYNKTLEIELIKKIRPEWKFKDEESLKERIKKDRLKAEGIFSWSLSKI